MAHGRVNIRTSEKTGKTRLRFFGVAADQLEDILQALSVARMELDTKYDSVALEAICLSYLNSEAGQKKTPNTSPP
jgi:hypothetical protein